MEKDTENPTSDSSNVSTPSLLLPNTDSFVLMQEFAAKLLQYGETDVTFDNLRCSTPTSDASLPARTTLDAQDDTLVPQKDNTIINSNISEESAQLTLQYSDDSVKDPTYTPQKDNRHNQSVTSSVDSLASLNSPPPKVTKTKQSTQFDLESDLTPLQRPQSQHCEFESCELEVYSTCGKCLCFLCYEHFVNEISYNNCSQHSSLHPNNVSENAQTVGIPIIFQATSSPDNPVTVPEINSKQHCEYGYCNGDVFSSCEKCSCFLCLAHYEDLETYHDCSLHRPYSTDIPYYYDKADTPTSKKKKAKFLRNTGQEYCSSRNKMVPQRKVKTPCDEKCRLKCTTLFSDKDRSRIFFEYWKLGDINRQRDFIVQHIQQITPNYRYEKYCCRKRERTLNNGYYFTNASKKVRVCKRFFKSTLDINDRVINTAIEKLGECGTVAKDKRGKHNCHPKKSEERKDVHEFINAIPRIESHYLRAQTAREFVDGGLTLTQIYNDYKNKAVSLGNNYVSQTIFSQIFHQDFNISFFVPKKDLCEFCEAYKNSSEEERQSKKREHEEHLREKELSRKEKELDKNKISPDYVVSCYDLQAILPSPRGDVSLFYYISKLATYNLTISQLKSSETTCYIWHEGQGNRGVTEIGSCVYKYLHSLSTTSIRENIDVVFYSDNCCGQQKNKFIISMYVYAVAKLHNISSITHKFLIKGHTQNEGDAVHSVIEKQIKRSLKSGPIFVPEDYISLIRTAKKNPPYFRIEQLSFKDFYDLKENNVSIGNNYSRTDDNKTIKMQDIKIIKVEKGDPFSFYVKTSYDQKEFLRINIRKGRKQYAQVIPDLSQAYLEKMTICPKKKDAILKLIQSNHIPKVHFDFYNSL